MTLEFDAKEYLVHVDTDNRLWTAESGQPPVSYEGGADFFIRNTAYHPNCTIKMIASLRNTSIILHLYDKKLRAEIKGLQLCSPLVMNKNKTVEVIMMDMLQWNGWPASLGGWHEFTEDDYPSYYLAKHFAENENSMCGLNTDLIEDTLRFHPAWKALSFIPHLNREKIGKLIATILDPRWFVDTKDPDKNARLENYLGLKPEIQSMVGDPELPRNDAKAFQLRNCKLVMRAWRMGRPVSKNEYDQPNNFLWRIHAMEGCNNKADLRVSQTFIAFLKAVWLDGIYKNKPGSKDGLFVPRYFFNKPDEIESFKAHMELK